MMLTLALGLHVFFSQPGIADMVKMQGHWLLKLSTDGVSNERYPNGITVLIKGNQIISLSKDENERWIFEESDDHNALNRMGIDASSKPKKIGIAWSEGIYELNSDTMRFCTKYHGQGVEGEAARRWKAPVDFVVRAGQSHDLWSFERIKKK